MRPEILAPVGNEEALEAAIQAGCDAIYFGLPAFGARAYAKNFTLYQTKDIIDRCHLLGIKVYITMNTVLYEDEIEDAYLMAKKLHEMNVDALIIQDLGFLHLLHHRLPNLTLHASTQISASKPEMIYKLKELGVKRVVLARECSLDEIKACVETGMEIEVFVHGALCISYSGQCYFSSLRYGRSGNRGMCAQPCRMPYNLLENGKKISGVEYFLSPKDVSVIEKVKELQNIGVVSLKIEGRMKSAAYVYESVSKTKKVLDGDKLINQDKEDLMVTFNRGYTLGHAYLKKGYDLMNTKTCNHQGIKLGVVTGKKNRRIQIKLERDIHQKDGIRIGKDTGCHVNFLYDEFGKLTNFMPAGSTCEIDGPKEVRKGDEVLKTTSIKINEEVETLIKETNRQASLDAHISCTGVGYPLVCKVFDETCSIEITSNDVAQKALNRATDEAVIRKQFNKTKDSYAYFDSITFDLADDIFFTISTLNELRRNALEAFKNEKLKVNELVELEYDYKLRVVSTTSNIYEVYDPKMKLDIDGLWVSEIDQTKGNISSVLGDVVSHLGNSKIIDGMNVTNSYAVAALIELGYEQIVVSDECSLENIEDIMNAFRQRYGFNAPLIKTIYQKRKLMTMNHCIVNTALKDGKRKECALCHQNEYQLLGKDGSKVLCVGDRDCHMRIFDVDVSNEIKDIEKYTALGISHFKINFLNETKDEMISVIKSLKG